MRHLKSLGTTPFWCILITAAREYHEEVLVLTTRTPFLQGLQLRFPSFQVWASLSG